MAKRTESGLRNLRIEIGVDDDDPSKLRVIAGADIIDEDGAVLSHHRREFDEINTHALEPLVREITETILAERGITEEDIQGGKDRQEQRRQEREAQREEAQRLQREQVEAAGEALRQRHGPDIEAEIEAAKARILTEMTSFQPLPLPPGLADLIPLTPEDIEARLEQAVQSIEGEREQEHGRLREASERYTAEQAERARNEAAAEAERARHEAENAGQDTPPVLDRRPRR